MSSLSAQAINQAIFLYNQQVGRGDLTTETLWPYPRHTEAEIRVKEPVTWFPFSILDAVMKQGDSTLSVQLKSENKAPYSSGDTVATIEGNGRAILTSWSVSRSLISFLSCIHRKISNTVNQLNPARIEVIHNFDLPIGYDKLIRFAVEEGGGISYGTGLDEIVYLSSDHITWVGSLSEALKRTINEVGKKRTLIKVLVEVSTPDEVTFLSDANADLIYCRNFTLSDINQIGDLTQGWVRLVVDETIPLDEVKGLRHKGVRIYVVNVNNLFTAKELFTIQFNG